MDGGGGDTLGYAGCLECRFANLAIRRPPVWRRGDGSQPLLKEAHMPSASSHLHTYLNKVRRLAVARRRAAIAGEAV
jgi:hypothetical protein